MEYHVGMEDESKKFEKEEGASDTRRRAGSVRVWYV